MAQISPIFNIPFFQDVDGNPLEGGMIFQYEAGSFSVLKETFTTEAGNVGNANPIVLNSAGQLPPGVAIWLTPGEAYNLVLTEADGTTVLKSFDDVRGVSAASGGGAGSSAVWVNTPGATYLSPTSFLVPGNVTAEYAIGNRVRVTQSGGFVYGTVTGSSFSSPNTTITIVSDGIALNSSVSDADWSVLIAAGRTVDAGGVAFTTAMPYISTNTVGNKLHSLDADIATTNTRIDPLRRVWPTAGTGAYTIAPSPAITTYSTDQVFTVNFGTSTVGAGTLNVNGVGAVALKVYTSGGAKVNPSILANTVSDVAYDGTDFILLDVLPPAAAAAPPFGRQVFTTNGVFTTPADVFTIKVTCVGGGGGAGTAAVHDGESGTVYWPSGGGGGGAVASVYIGTTPGTNYNVAIGAGGNVGGAGGTSSFGVTLGQAGGGSPGGNGVSFGGSSGQVGQGGAGGTSGVGFIIPGGRGTAGIGPNAGAGVGGGSPGFSGGGSVYGGGGGGSATTSGAAGSPGVVLVEWA